MPSLDAHLPSWQALNDRHPCTALLVGNGASRAVWKPFGYFSLFEEAQRVRHKALGVSDQALFKSLGTELFEPVLSTLNTTVRANAALAINSTAPLNRYYSIKEALIHATRAVHLPWTRVPSDTLATINQALRSYRNVYTSNYDLLLPWAVNQAPEGFATLFDEQGFFDVRRTATEGIRIVHLHGGLHLLKLPDGTTRQRSAECAELLEGFAVNIPGKCRCSSTRAAAKKNCAPSAPRTTCRGVGPTVRGTRGPMPVRPAPDASDQHLLEAIRQARPTHLSIAIRPLSEASIINQKQHFMQRFADLPERPCTSSTPPATRWATRRWRSWGRQNTPDPDECSTCHGLLYTPRQVKRRATHPDATTSPGNAPSRHRTPSAARSWPAMRCCPRLPALDRQNHLVLVGVLRGDELEHLGLVAAGLEVKGA